MIKIYNKVIISCIQHKMNFRLKNLTIFKIKKRVDAKNIYLTVILGLTVLELYNLLPPYLTIAVNLPFLVNLVILKVA